MVDSKREGLRFKKRPRTSRLTLSKYLDNLKQVELIGAFYIALFCLIFSVYFQHQLTKPDRPKEHNPNQEKPGNGYGPNLKNGNDKKH